MVSIKILNDIGIDYLTDYAAKLGIKSQDLSLALGSKGFPVGADSSAYGSLLQAQGDKADPVFITKIVDRMARCLEENSLWSSMSSVRRLLI